MAGDEQATTGEQEKPKATGSGPAVRTLFEQRRDYLSQSLSITKADATARLNSLVGNYAAKKGMHDEGPARDFVLDLDPERLLDLLAHGAHEAARLLK